MNFLILIAIVNFLTTSIGYSTPAEIELIAPANDYDNGYPESRYDHVLETVEKTYGPRIKDLGGRLEILSDWGDGAVNMWADRIGDTYQLEIPGGMARYYLIIEEAFVLSICHELGHLLGGAPMNGQISYEGQADYFATSECSELLLKEISPFKELPYSNEVKEKCESVDSQNTSLCHRVLQGALSLTAYYAKLKNQVPPTLSKPSKDIAEKTIRSHPEPQCRLDTLVTGYFSIARPKCWFAD